MQEAKHYPQLEHGDEAVDFGSFYTEQVRDLARFIAHRVSHAQDAQDIVAEVMCEFVEACTRRPDTRHYRPLLYTIAKRRLTDYYATRTKRYREIPLDDAPQLPAHGSLVRDLEVGTELQLVKDAIAMLREEDREIITLSAVVGLSADEIADIMSTSSGAIRVRIYVARKKLKRLLKGQEQMTGIASVADSS